jgi:hypothetical protein
VHAQCPLLLVQQDHAQVLDVVIKASFDRKAAKLKRPPRSLVISGFVHTCMERINLTRFMLSSAVTSMVPTAVWDGIGKPMEAFKYSVAPYLAIANFSNVAVNAAKLRSRGCKCHEAWAAPFRNPATQHITTKDLRLAARFDERLAALMAKGTKYRESFCELYARPQPTSKADTAEDRVQYMFERALKKYVKRAEEEHGVYPSALATWEVAVLEHVEAFTATLSATTKDELMSGGQRQPTTELCGEALKAMQRDYVMCEADKESGVYTMCCACYYVEKNFGELEAPTTYTAVGEGSAPPRRLPIYDGALAGLGANGMPADAYMARLVSDFNFNQAQGMLTRAKDSDGKAYPKLKVPSADGGEGREEEPMEYWVRNHRLASQYAAVKTHKPNLSLRVIAGGRNNSLEAPNQWLSEILWVLKPSLDAIHSDATSKCQAEWMKERWSGQSMETWVVQQSKSVSRRVGDYNAEVRRHRARGRRYADQRARRVDAQPSPEELRDGPTTTHNVPISVYDFTTLFPSMPHEGIHSAIGEALAEIFALNVDKEGKERALCIDRSGDKEDRESKWVDVTAAIASGQGDKGRVKHFTRERIKELVDRIVGHAYTTFGGRVYRQHAGVPIGFGASPALANFALAWRELKGIRKIVRDASAPDGTFISTPGGRDQPLDARLRVRQFDLAGRLARCCRNIDDVLFFDIKKGEVDWALEIFYPSATGLELKCECATWEGDGEIHYLDMYIRDDGHGMYTTVYDKRTALAAAGMMGEVRRFPHVLSKLSETCKYAVLTSFLNALHDRVMRKGEFVKYAAERVLDMRSHGYSLDKLMDKLFSFVRHKLLPERARGHVATRLRHAIAKAVVEADRLATRDRARERIRSFVRRRALPELRRRMAERERLRQQQLAAARAAAAQAAAVAQAAVSALARAAGAAAAAMAAAATQVAAVQQAYERKRREAALRAVRRENLAAWRGVTQRSIHAHRDASQRAAQAYARRLLSDSLLAGIARARAAAVKAERQQSLQGRARAERVWAERGGIAGCLAHAARQEADREHAKFERDLGDVLDAQMDVMVVECRQQQSRLRARAEVLEKRRLVQDTARRKQLWLVRHQLGDTTVTLAAHLAAAAAAAAAAEAAAADAAERSAAEASVAGAAALRMSREARRILRIPCDYVDLNNDAELDYAWRHRAGQTATEAQAISRAMRSLLGTSAVAPAEEVRKAYRAKCLMVHPDKYVARVCESPGGAEGLVSCEEMTEALQRLHAAKAWLLRQ